MIELTVNGETRRVAPGITVAQLIDALQLTGKRIALEKNGEIVPRSRFGEERLMEGDRLEIVVAVGGG
ncbi:sulfur carrier protein ThiS [Pelomicrobium methylotrophicum]|uniref:Sulfur carrier protein ThiS n=1 Tax=Pelomicrobium methylotrophicum TaxID=2602750 RepID=A0A5C7EVJ7_9PROT|nr:sulfur carrier protein ThiS [Pelomicrobium methylotrophicum]TXF12883.1 sulfur carrier protein ThiS [Pelomicrobium methylotrophicum]